MADGLEIKDSNGRVVYSTKDITWLLAEVFTVYGGTYNKSYGHLAGAFKEISWSIQLIDVTPENYEAYSPKVYNSGFDITVTNQSGTSRYENAIISVFVR
jgi:hypothetical protein